MPPAPGPLPTDPLPTDPPAPPAPPPASPEAAIQRLERRLARERAAREAAERLLEAKAAELYQASRAVAETAAALSRRVAELEAERALSRALTQAKAEVEAESAARARFFATLSHELRTPLNGVVALAELLAESPLDPEQQSHVATIRDCGGALVATIGDFLDLARLEAGSMPLERRDFAPLALLESAADIAAAGARGRRLPVIVAAAGALPARLGGADPSRIRQVMVNLLGNAVKFTAAGHVLATLRVDPDGADADAWRLRVAVRDTGPGFTESEAARLFQDFAQLGAGTAGRFGGSGLGLAICRRLVEAMGGSISAEAVPGQGATFRFEVPVRLAAAPDPPPAPARCALAVADPALGAAFAAALASAGIATDGGPPTLAWDAATAELLVRRGPGDDAALATAGTAHAFTPARLRRLLLDAPEAQPAPQPDARAPAAGGGLDVLVAEDNPVNQRVASLMLRRLGHRASIAADGAAALQALAAQRFDLVLMDMQMPGMDGPDCARAIRAAEPAGTRLPIIAMTANAFASDRETCLAAGMDDFLTKPIDSARLAAALARATASASAARGTDADEV